MSVHRLATAVRVQPQSPLGHWGLCLTVCALLAACGRGGPTDVSGGSVGTSHAQPLSDPSGNCNAPVEPAAGCESLYLGGHAYMRGPGAGEFMRVVAGQDQIISTGLDVVDSITGEHQHSDPESNRLFVAGCDGGVGRILVYHNASADGVADDLLGSYDLPAGARAVALASRVHTRELWYLDGASRDVMRLFDGNGDGVPDSIGVYAAHTQPSMEHVGWLYAHAPTVLVASDMARHSDYDMVTILRDTNADGVLESIERTSLFELDYQGPQFSSLIVEGAMQVVVFGARGSNVEVWRTDSDGVKVSSDPQVGRVALGTIGTASVEQTLVLQSAAVEGEHLRIFDLTRPSAGVVQQVASAHAQFASATPTDFRRTAGPTLVVLGTGFDASLSVVLRGPRGAETQLAIVPGSLTATRVDLIVPSLGSEFLGRCTLIGKTSDSPEVGTRLGIMVLEP